MNINLDKQKVCEVMTKHKEAQGVLYCLELLGQKFEQGALNSAYNSVFKTLGYLSDSNSLIDHFTENEPQVILLNTLTQSYKTAVLAYSGIDFCVMEIRNNESESCEIKSNYTKALFAAHSILFDLVELYESMIENPPAAQAA
ncbi:hypothetical protein [Pseudoalteromonas sp. SG43-5]|uniref:hypothetical protein n=1 Tax=Pseudoalteromonas sp. SG43-5 TaxID=2760968 RepID=UPI001603EF78|nr:hypothetical protein [Pseudoalteromonas sp. SG43-5]MBB1455217.1 hypothetical protein [Pseudoalteromonas sp. SG43-5]